MAESTPSTPASLGYGAADSGAKTEPPLCVGLDRALIRSDIACERLARALREPSVLARCIVAAFGLPLPSIKGRINTLLAEGVSIDVAYLPYNTEVIQFIAKQRAIGRKAFLVTASDLLLAKRISEHLGLFDEVLSPTLDVNVRRTTKAEAVISRLGHQGFSYIGHDATDLPVWNAAAEAILVDTPPSVAARLRPEVPRRTLSVREPTISTALRALRSYQWVKNLLVFVPIITAFALDSVAAWLGSFLAFIAFSLTASGLYLVNDILDLEADRRHPTKAFRPLAAGTMSVCSALILAPALMLPGLVVALAAGAPVLTLVVAYGILSAAYSMVLKRQALVDVFALAALYTLRLYAGGKASGHEVSQWLLAFSGFLFLSLALMKRVSELSAVADRGALARRGYHREDSQLLIHMGIGAMFASGVVLALYVQSTTALGFYSSPLLAWLIVPLLIFWQCRLWMSTCRGGYVHDDPIVYMVKDRVSILVGLCVFVALIGARIL